MYEFGLIISNPKFLKYTYVYIFIYGHSFKLFLPENYIKT